MGTPNLHDDLMVFDGLNVSDWTPEVFEDMRTEVVSPLPIAPARSGKIFATPCAISPVGRPGFAITLTC
jgi:hypothetical protein